MRRKPGSYVRSKNKELKPNLDDHAMAARCKNEKKEVNQDAEEQDGNTRKS